MPSTKQRINHDAIITSTGFAAQLRQAGIHLQRHSITTLQVNIGKRCNQACNHCHVEAGPKHPDNMQGASIDRLIGLLRQSPAINTVDITGGAPELNPHFRRFVQAIRAMDKQVIDRCNLTILFEDGQQDTANFLAQNQVAIVASLPCYSEANVDAQRGKNVFHKSIEALQQLNALGYGSDKALPLDLVYNPLGANLPPDQQQLEQDFKARLQADFGIQFNRLYTLANMPIKRFAHQLQRDGKLQEYMQLLIDNFNPATAENLMCNALISIGFDGQIYDCDFNQMLELPLTPQPQTIFSIDSFADIGRDITVAEHCYGCTAGSGSSCGGALVES